jgi:Protein of unknown function DUF262
MITATELFKTKTSKVSWTVEDLINKVTKNQIAFIGNAVEGFSWSEMHQSRFIESILAGFPIQPIILYKSSEDSNCLQIIDGKERINAIFNFSQCDYLLEGLTLKPELNGKHYEQIQDDNEIADITATFDRQLLDIIIIENCNENILKEIKSRLNNK